MNTCLFSVHQSLHAVYFIYLYKHQNTFFCLKSMQKKIKHLIILLLVVINTSQANPPLGFLTSEFLSSASFNSAAGLRSPTEAATVGLGSCGATTVILATAARGAVLTLV